MAIQKTPGFNPGLNPFQKGPQTSGGQQNGFRARENRLTANQETEASKFGAPRVQLPQATQATQNPTALTGISGPKNSGVDRFSASTQVGQAAKTPGNAFAAGGLNKGDGLAFAFSGQAEGAPKNNLTTGFSAPTFGGFAQNVGQRLDLTT